MKKHEKKELTNTMKILETSGCYEWAGDSKTGSSRPSQHTQQHNKTSERSFC
jgi:hypothetical protein